MSSRVARYPRIAAVSRTRSQVDRASVWITVMNDQMTIE